MSVIRDAEIEQDLKDLSRPVFEQAGLSPETVRFVLIDSPDLNAFVAGGQNIFLNTGLILETGSAAELVGVIAHETGHIAAGHIFRTREEVENATLQSVLASIIGVAAAIGTRSGDAGAAAITAGQALAQQSILRHSRVQESAADQAGVRFLKSARLPVEGFLSFMQKLESQELLPASQQMEYVRTHPLTRDRVDFLENVVTKQASPATPPARWAEKHARMRAKLRGYLQPARMMQEKGDDIATRYGHAIALYRRGRIDDALQATEALIKAEPGNAYFHELKGQILMETGRVAQAVAPYAKSVELAPDAGLIRIAYAHALLESGTDKIARRAEAIRQLTRALQGEPHAALAHRLLGIAYGQQGDEGLSRLHLAEEALLRGKPDDAAREAVLAQSKLPRHGAAYLRAEDILDAASRAQENKKP